MRFDQQGVGHQSGQRARVGQREQPVHRVRRAAAHQPRLQQRTGGSEQKIRQADRCGQQQQDCSGGVLTAGRPEAVRRYDRQAQQAGGQQCRMHGPLPAGRQPVRQPVRVAVPGQQHRLKEHHAGGPHTGTAPEPGQDLLGDDGLNQEQQQRGQRDGGGVQRHQGRDSRTAMDCSRRCGRQRRSQATRSPQLVCGSRT